ncbi:hypothetical protein GWK47_042110 [Chionoecetes opilio]|uniref:Uncharacterized protein n=1 Tax=Chionoecetes opilio TaxID=41210 RepID=A0A8J4YAQ1_CHIOP|nr:hypothetical protein GWK47_042110 [Chionoecetes opilio]
MRAGNPGAMHLLALRWRHRRLFRNVNKIPLRPHMATDTPDARMPPVASRYCCCVCGKKRHTHPGARLHLFPIDARSPLTSVTSSYADLISHMRTDRTGRFYVRIVHIVSVISNIRRQVGPSNVRLVHSPLLSRILRTRDGLCGRDCNGEWTRRTLDGSGDGGYYGREMDNADVKTSSLHCPSLVRNIRRRRGHPTSA